MISSTKPSSPRKAVRWLARSTLASKLFAHCSLSSWGEIMSIRFDSNHTENALQIVVAEESDFKRAFAAAITQGNFGAEAFAHFVLHRYHMQVASGNRRAAASGPVACCGLLVLQCSDQFFRLPHGQAVLDYTFRREVLMLV